MRKEIQPDKLRDMVRSILPSTKREGARRHKDFVHRQTRRGVRIDLNTVDVETTPRDLLRDGYIAVWWRRQGDKLNHFMRWCEAMTRGMRREDALAYVRSILPRNVIGDHAYSHWESHLRHRFRWQDTRARRQQSIIDSTRFHLRRVMETEPDVLGRLNAAIKAGKALDEPRRLLHGIHDVDDFVREVVSRDAYAVERKVLMNICHPER